MQSQNIKSNSRHKLEGKRDKSTIVVDDFNRSFPETDKSGKENDRDVGDLNNRNSKFQHLQNSAPSEWINCAILNTDRTFIDLNWILGCQSHVLDAQELVLIRSQGLVISKRFWYYTITNGSGPLGLGLEEDLQDLLVKVQESFSGGPVSFLITRLWVWALT